ncbi:serine/threonine-protein kinase [Luteimonas granuli]|uniref:Tetratricopeptide repeat protein n=1 Tax=Luteimonas granuli TaxID=1176533 RepID=A0A518N379_9GAMM|nr:serine/threonine-protein kinase [Luteimonas granuli]QDW66395.1 tetratricopeptide repeat protein [Luteimonas granuli]
MAEREGMDAWKQADALFDQWLDIEAAGREAWLAARDTDPGVRARLQRLIDAHLRPSAVLATPASDLSGVRLGNWTLESELGRGGMAVVYRASRSDGIARQDAALKVLTVGALGATGRDRFQREAEILARLNHPNITPLIDSGTGPDGTCWLAMPLVEGQRIDAWCDSHRLDARGVARLFLQVCDAVAFAHRNLVIHRDLKPSNVLVEADGHVRLLDFGIGQFADAEGECTQTLWRALTPGYAAPEQLHGALPTTAIDIYGLGALLHRLLTGRTPRSSDERAITTRPSALVRASGDAYHRHYTPLKNDLDRVLLKALAEEPERRYHSVEAFADDLRRWLDGRPVMARQPGMAYRARKFVGRNKVGVAAAVLVAASLAAGLGATLWQAREARLEAERALAARNFMVQLFEASDPDVAQGRVITARELLDQGAHQIRTAFPDTPHLRTEMLLLLGELYRRIGELEAAAPLVREGAELAGIHGDGKQLLQAKLGLAGLHMSELRHEEAVAEFEQAEALLASTGKVPGPEHGRMLVDLGASLASTGQVPAAIGRLEAALELARRHDVSDETLFSYLFALASTLDMFGTGQAQRADDLLREALSLQSIDSMSPSRRLPVHTTLFGLALERGDLEEAHAQADQAVELTRLIHAPTHPEQAVVRINVALALLHIGRLGEAEARLREALALQEAIDPEGRTPLRAGTYHNLALALELAERDEEAEPFSSGAREMALEQYGPQDMHFAIATTNLGNLYRRLGRFDEAEPLLEESLTLRRNLLGDAHPQVGHTILQLSLLRLDQGRAAEALAFVDEALAVYAKAEYHDPRRVAVAEVQRARALAKLGRVQEAAGIFDRVVTEARAAGVDNGTQWVRTLAARADFMDAYRPALARPAITEAFEAYSRTFGEDHPGTRRYAARASGSAEAPAH